MYDDDYISWGNYTSKDSSNPDVLDLELLDLKVFPNRKAITIKVAIKTINGKIQKKFLGIKYFNSKNFDLLKLWEESLENKWLRMHGSIRIKTWLGISKRNSKRLIRRYKLIVLD